MIIFDIIGSPETWTLAGVGTLLTVFIIPLIKYVKKEVKYREKERSHMEEIDTKLYTIAKQLEGVIKNHEDIEELNGKFDQFLKDYEDFYVQGLKHIINDAYFYPEESLSEIPDALLFKAAQCCDIYVKEKKLNHEIKPRCEKIWAELERRSLINKEVDK